MENISSRGSAQFVGYFDLILTIIGAAILTGAFIYVLLETNLDSERDSSFIMFLVIIGVVLGLYILLSIFLSILLLKATQLTADPKKSLKRVKIWLGVNISLFVLGIIKGLLRGDLISLVVLLFVRGPLILLVQKYKNNLTDHCVDRTSPPPRTFST